MGDRLWLRNGADRSAIASRDAIVDGSLMFNERARVGALALKIPTINVIAEMLPYGLLMSYGRTSLTLSGRPQVDKLVVKHMGGDGVLSAPSMIGLMERLAGADRGHHRT